MTTSSAISDITVSIVTTVSFCRCLIRYSHGCILLFFTYFTNYQIHVINALASGRFQFNSRYVIFKLTVVNGGWGISYEIALRWMPIDFTDDKSILVQVMAWCHQATSHYLSQCWPRSMSPNGVTKAQWVNFHLFFMTASPPLWGHGKWGHCFYHIYASEHQVQLMKQMKNQCYN